MQEITAEYLASQGLSETFPQRFWSKVILGEACWLWIGAKNEHGYGILGVGGRGCGFVKAHRASWILHRGPIPKGFGVLHHCDNPPCVRPDHLFLGTQKDNGQDAASKGRMPKGEQHWNSILSNSQVRTIRSIYIKYAKNQKQIADQFGISVFTLRRICYGTRWKHIT